MSIYRIYYMDGYISGLEGNSLIDNPYKMTEEEKLCDECFDSELYELSVSAWEHGFIDGVEAKDKEKLIVSCLRL